MDDTRSEINLQIIRAVRHGTLQEVEDLINTHGLYGLECDGYVILRDAIERKRYNIIHFLLYCGCKVNCNNTTSLHIAISYGLSSEIAKKIVQIGADVRLQDSNGNTSLNLAVQRGNFYIAQLLIDYGASVNTTNFQQETPIYYAVKNGYKEIVKLLLRNGAKGGGTLLPSAVKCVNKDDSSYIVKLLLDYGASVDYVCQVHNNTALHYAVENALSEIVLMLLEKKANVNAKTNKNETLLQIAVQPTHPYPSIQKTAIIKYLLEYGADVSHAYKDGTTVLHLAVKNENLEYVEILLENKADVNAMTNENVTPLQIAASKNRSDDIIELLLKYGADVNHINNAGESILHLAVQHGSLETVRILLENKAYVNSKTNKNETSLQFSVRRFDSASFVELLLKYGADINHVDNKGKPILHLYVEKGKLDDVRLFLDANANANILSNDNVTPLEIALKQRENHYELIKLLLEFGADINHITIDGKSMLFLAVKSRNLNVVNDILSLSPDKNNLSNRRSIVTSIHNKDINITNALLDYGLSVHTDNVNEYQLLQDAAEMKQWRIVEDLLDSGIGDKKIIKTLLHYSVEEGNLRMTEILLKKESSDNKKLLALAVKKNYIEIVKVLLEYGCDIHEKCYHGGSLLFNTTCITKNLDDYINAGIAKLLLSKGADPNDKTKFGLSVLHTASFKKYQNVVKILLKYNANVNLPDELGQTALHFAVQKRNSISYDLCERERYEIYYEQQIRVLLDTETGRNSIFNKERPLPFHSRTKNIIKMLLNKGADVDAITNEGFTPLRLAISNHFKEDILKDLLDNGADVNKISKGFPPLSFALKNSAAKCIIIALLNKGADVNIVDSCGFFPLHLAVSNYHDVDIINDLINKGADVNAVAKDGSTPLVFAVEQRKNDIVKMLIEKGSNTNILKYGRNLLYIAIKNRDSQTIEILLNYGAEIDMYCSQYRYESEIIAVLTKHLIKLMSANLDVNPVINYFYDEIKYTDFEKKCQEEILKVKNEKINQTTISFYDILTKNTVQLSKYMKNANITQILETGYVKIKFPIYGLLIKSNFRKGMQRKQLLDKQELFKTNTMLPEDCYELIYDYLCDTDLKNLIIAFELTN